MHLVRFSTASVSACLFGCALASRAYALPAFPGAEGYGANATGGRGGDVYYVTNLEDYGTGSNAIAGSLRYGIESATNSRTILFKVSGNIRLKAKLAVNKPRITIAGQTAPGDGICLQDYTIFLDASDLIMRHVRTRLGTNAFQQADAMSITAGTNIMVDHCSASWSVDETLSPTDRAQNLTVQWTYITESLNESIHKKGPHGYGSLIRPKIDAYYTFHHDLYAHHSSRNPRAGSYGDKVLRLDFRNNVIYNWGIKAGYNYYPGEHLELNYINNYLVRGPSTTCFSCAFDSVATNTYIFQSGNRFDVNLNGRLDGVDTGWHIFIGDHRKLSAPHAVAAVATDSAEVAYERVLAQAGAMPWRRDPVDTRVTSTVRDQNGQIIDCTDQVGGWPALHAEAPPVDSDNDGMPDYWEEAVGLNPNNPDDRNDTTASGFTQLEEYLQWLSEPHAIGHLNTMIDVDLRRLNGASGKNLTLAVGDAVHGSVRLLRNGRLARFVPQKDFVGRASFRFHASDAVTGVGFGPTSVGLLIG